MPPPEYVWGVIRSCKGTSFGPTTLPKLLPKLKGTSKGAALVAILFLLCRTKLYSTKQIAKINNAPKIPSTIPTDERSLDDESADNGAGCVGPFVCGTAVVGGDTVISGDVVAG